MKGQTHAVTAAFIITAVLKLPLETASAKIVLAGTIGALIPDIDIANSKITHMITRNNTNSILLQNVLKIIILNALGLILSIYYSKNVYPLILSIYLSILSLTAHRTLSHSLLSLVIVIWLTSMIISNRQITTSIGLGYLVHLFEDMLNSRGIPLFYPMNFKNQRTPIVTNKIAEFIFCIVILAICSIKISRTLAI